MARRQTTKPKTEAPTLIREGDTFVARNGLTEVLAAVYVLDGFGPRIIATNPKGDHLTPSVKACVHGRPIRPRPARFGGVDAGNPEGFAQLCRACAYEVDTIRRRNP